MTEPVLLARAPSGQRHMVRLAQLNEAAPEPRVTTVRRVVTYSRNEGSGGTEARAGGGSEGSAVGHGTGGRGGLEPVRRGVVNIAPVLTQYGNDSLSVTVPDSLVYWQEHWDRAMNELGQAWAIEEAAGWIRDLPGFTELLDPRSFDELLEGHAGLALVPDSPLWAPTVGDVDISGAQLVWDEAVELEGQRLLVYLQDDGALPYVGFYTPGLQEQGRDSEERVRLTTRVLPCSLRRRHRCVECAPRLGRTVRALARPHDDRS
jgi:hypothetical protein